MKIYIAIGAVLVTLLLVGGVILLSQEEEPAPQQPQTTVSSSTQATDEDSTDDSDDQNDTDKEQVVTDKAVYTKFSVEAFRAASDEDRILFFYDSTHAPSVRLDEMLTASLKDLPDKLHIFKANFSEQKELAEQFGVTETGASLKFDTNTQLSAVYIATDSSDIATYKKVLSLE